MDIGKSNERKQTRPLGQVGAGPAAVTQSSVPAAGKRDGKQAAQLAAKPAAQPAAKPAVKPAAKLDLPKAGKGRNWERKYEEVNARSGSTGAHAATGNPGGGSRNPQRTQATSLPVPGKFRTRGGDASIGVGGARGLNGLDVDAAAPTAAHQAASEAPDSAKPKVLTKDDIRKIFEDARKRWGDEVYDPPDYDDLTSLNWDRGSRQWAFTRIGGGSENPERPGDSLPPVVGVGRGRGKPGGSIHG